MEPNLSQALHLLNGDATHRRVNQSQVIPSLLKQDVPPMEIVAHLYLRTLGREPTDREHQRLAAQMEQQKKPDERRALLDDIFWALLNSKEFIFNH